MAFDWQAPHGNLSVLFVPACARDAGIMPEPDLCPVGLRKRSFRMTATFTLVVTRTQCSRWWSGAAGQHLGPLPPQP